VPSGDAPIDATVYCRVEINGVAAPGTTFGYTGARGLEAGANQVSFSAAPSDIIVLDERVVYADGSDTGWDFQCGDCFSFPPDEVIADIDLVFSYIEPQVCPILATHAGTYGPITIGPDGDVYVPDPTGLGLNPIENCPPYGNF
jgi:hypothetical protein